MFKKLHPSGSNNDVSTQELIDWSDAGGRRKRTSARSDRDLAAQPHMIRKWDSGRIISIFLDGILLVLALIFAAYGISVKRYEGFSPKTQIYQNLSQASRLAPTIFPILFAAIVGRALKAIALWRLERGSHLGHLDQLVGSSSITTAITTQFQLRALNLLSVSLIGLWALSPVGGQASIRVLEVKPTITNYTTDIQFLNLSSNALNDQYDGADTAGLFTQSNSLFAASLSSVRTTRYSQVDSWGNVKIPILEALNSSAADAQGWIDCDGSSIEYVSLIGLPFSQAMLGVNTSFDVETNYWRLNCSAPSPTQTPSWSNFSNWDYVTGGMYLSSPRSYLNNSWTASGTKCRQITYSGWDPTPYNASIANCTMFSSYVEARVHCGTNLSCSVTQIRRSKTAHPPVCWTQLDVSGPDFVWYSSALVNSLGTFHEAYQTTFQGYLTRPDNPFNVTLIPPIYTLDKATFTIRFSQILNTYWYALLGSSSVQLGVSNENVNQTASQDQSTVGTTQGIVTIADDLISCNDTWLAFLLITVILLILINLTGIFATTQSLGPEILFNVSSMIRESPHVTLPQTSSALSGTDRARVLKHVKVRYGDVDGDEDIGSIAVATPHGNMRPSPLRQNRFYS